MKMEPVFVNNIRDCHTHCKSSLQYPAGCLSVLSFRTVHDNMEYYFQQLTCNSLDSIYGKKTDNLIIAGYEGVVNWSIMYLWNICWRSDLSKPLTLCVFFSYLYIKMNNMKAKICIITLCEGIHKWPVVIPQKGTIMQKMKYSARA